MSEDCLQGSSSIQCSDCSFFFSPSKFRSAKLTVEGKSVYVNPHFLGEISPFFESLFFGNFEEAKTQDAELKDESFDSIKELLLVVGASPNDDRQEINAKNCAQMIRLSDKLDVMAVRRRCMKYLEIGILTDTPTVEEAAEMLIACLQHRISSSSLSVINLISILGGFGLEHLFKLELHKKISCPITSAALFACATENPDGMKCNPKKTHSFPSNSASGTICYVIDCRKSAPQCGSCGLSLCVDHQSIECPRNNNYYPVTSMNPPQTKRKRCFGSTGSFRMVPYRLRHAPVDSSFFDFSK